MNAQLIQLGGSLVAILLLALIAKWLGLGRDVRIANVAEAKALAASAIAGFDARDVALDRAGLGALLRDDAGRFMILRRHGARFVGRMLDSHSHCRLDRDFLNVATSEYFARPVILHLGKDAKIWASRLRELGG